MVIDPEPQGEVELVDLGKNDFILKIAEGPWIINEHYPVIRK